MRLRILRRHIDAAILAKSNGGQPYNTCPIAQALKERNYSDVRVTRTYWNSSLQENLVSGGIPSDTLNFIDTFDAGRLVSPQRVTLTINK